jgi:hypothetical protein
MKLTWLFTVDGSLLNQNAADCFLIGPRLLDPDKTGGLELSKDRV